MVDTGEWIKRIATAYRPKLGTCTAFAGLTTAMEAVGVCYYQCVGVAILFLYSQRSLALERRCEPGT